MLITDAYKAEQERLHATGKYGTASLQYGQIVSGLVEATGSKTLLDYGCGSMQNLKKVLDCDVLYLGYDPAVEKFSAKEPSDLVTCIDVLEHIEPDLLDNVLDDLLMLADKWAFFTVHTGPAVKVLSDGRNAHLIQKPPAWWLPKFLQRWDLETFQRTGQGFNVFLRAR
jgi:hypothetical protein